MADLTSPTGAAETDPLAGLITYEEMLEYHMRLERRRAADKYEAAIRRRNAERRAAGLPLIRHPQAAVPQTAVQPPQTASPVRAASTTRPIMSARVPEVIMSDGSSDAETDILETTRAGIASRNHVEDFARGSMSARSRSTSQTSTAAPVAQMQQRPTPTRSDSNSSAQKVACDKCRRHHKRCNHRVNKETQNPVKSSQTKQAELPAADALKSAATTIDRTETSSAAMDIDSDSSDDVPLSEKKRAQTQTLAAMMDIDSDDSDDIPVLGRKRRQMAQESKAAQLPPDPNKADQQIDEDGDELAQRAPQQEAMKRGRGRPRKIDAQTAHAVPSTVTSRPTKTSSLSELPASASLPREPPESKPAPEAAPEPEPAIEPEAEPARSPTAVTVPAGMRVPKSLQNGFFAAGMQVRPAASTTNDQTSPPPTNLPSTTATKFTERIAAPDWDRPLNSKERSSRDHNRGLVVTLQKIREDITKIESPSSFPRQDALLIDSIRTRLHDFEHLQGLTEFVLRDSRLLAPEQGLPRLWLTRRDGYTFPFDIRADAEALWRKWCRRDFDPDIMRGIVSGKGSGGAKSNSLAPDYPNKLHGKHHGPNDLVSGQWWPLQVAALRDGAHGEMQAGISGIGGKGACSVILAGSHYEDEDYGERILYCGIERTSTQHQYSADTELLRANVRTHLPVRVIRNMKLSNQYAPSFGFRYDGLYDVNGYEVLNAEKGHLRFELVRRTGQDPIRCQGIGKRPTEQDVAAYRKHRMLAGFGRGGDTDA